MSKFLNEKENKMKVREEEKKALKLIRQRTKNWLEEKMLERYIFFCQDAEQICQLVK